MLALAIFAASVPTQPQARPPKPLVQATATVRIVSAARITREETPEGALVRKTQVRTADGRPEMVRLVEFP